ncbi:MAG: hypothetical protein ACK4N5_27795, partial [Myxococcales bacterium]
RAFSTGAWITWSRWTSSSARPELPGAGGVLRGRGERQRHRLLRRLRVLDASELGAVAGLPREGEPLP